MPNEIPDSLKLYVNDELQKTRHKLANDIQTVSYSLDTKIDSVKESQALYDTALKLSTQSNDSLREELKSMNVWMQKLIDKIENLDKKFVTKEEHQNTKKTLDNIQKGLLWAIYLVLWGVIGALLKVIFIP